MKYLKIILNIIILSALFYIGYINLITVMSNNPNINTLELCYFLGAFMTVSFMLGIYSMYIVNNKKELKIKEYQRELERRGIDRDENSSKVKILESKIEVLEKALKEALKK